VIAGEAAIVLPSGFPKERYESMNLADTARLEEQRQAVTLSEIAGEWLEVGGGRAARGAPGIWANIAMGMGLDGPFCFEDVERAIDWYMEAGIEPRFELCPYVEPAFVEHCKRAGLVLRSFENVFYRMLDEEHPAALPQGLDPKIELRQIDPADQAEEYGHCIAAGFTPEGKPVREADIQAYTRTALHARTSVLGAIHQGRIVGGGAVEVAGEISSLYAASVLPEFRRRGIQQALMAGRLSLAQDQGARLATIGAKPGISTERNALRMGFRVAYTKVVLVKPGEGLTPVGGKRGTAERDLYG
jgi:GNAT superfamily N-acetyltransferase